MEVLGRTRRVHLRDKVSLHEIGKRTSLSPNTVRDRLRVPREEQGPTYGRTAGFSKLSGLVAELEQALKAEVLRSKKATGVQRVSAPIEC